MVKRKTSSSVNMRRRQDRDLHDDFCRRLAALGFRCSSQPP